MIDLKDFSLKNWERRRIEYWQPVLYFDANGRSLDFTLCAKNACSTIKAYYTWLKDPNFDYSLSKEDMNWIKRRFKLTDYDLEESNLKSHGFVCHYSTTREARVKKWLNHPNSCFINFFRNWADEDRKREVIKVAIKRDPIKRFLSAYIHTHNKTGWVLFRDHNYGIDEFIDKIKSGEYWNEHLQSQTWWMGNKENYDRVYDIKDTDECISFINKHLIMDRNPRKFEFMKSYTEKPEITRKQISKIEQLYIEDYENGWY